MIYRGQYCFWRDLEFLTRKYLSCAGVYLSKSGLFSDRPSRLLGFHCRDNLRAPVTAYLIFLGISFQNYFLWSLLHRVLSWRFFFKQSNCHCRQFSPIPSSNYIITSSFHHFRYTLKSTKKTLSLERTLVNNKIPCSRKVANTFGSEDKRRLWTTFIICLRMCVCVCIPCTRCSILHSGAGVVLECVYLAMLQWVTPFVCSQGRESWKERESTVRNKVTFW